MKTVLVKVYRTGDGYRARAGNGKAAKLASSTNSELCAARTAAAKYFGMSEAAAQLGITLESTGQGLRCGCGPGEAITLKATMPPRQGGAS
jgi:hypothetical protein